MFLVGKIEGRELEISGGMWKSNNIINPLNAELNPICHLLALLGGATIVVVSRLRVKADLEHVGLGILDLNCLTHIGTTGELL